MRLRLTLFLVLCLAAGCGGRNVVPVSGRVTLDDKPLAGVHVGFQPMATEGNKNPGGGSYAITDADGRYTLKLVEGGEPGAFVGKHRVEITVRGAEVDPNTDLRPKGGAAKVVIPPKFNRDTTLTFDVPAGGTDKADFPLTTH
jgi:hypothetical protein